MKQVFKILDQHLLILSQKAIFWEEECTLIISDLHLGKSHHFRKGGVAIPKMGDYQNLKSLKGLISVWKPERVILLGDLFHSEANNHVLEVVDFIQQFESIKMQLIIGNHDIMDTSWYKALHLEVHQQLVIGPFLFTHEPLDLDEIPNNLYNMAGHIHPCVRLRGKARQSLNLPCFYFGSKNAILPAFGKFTGTYRIHPSKKDSVFVVLDSKVVAV